MADSRDIYSSRVSAPLGGSAPIGSSFSQLSGSGGGGGGPKLERLRSRPVV